MQYATQHACQTWLLLAILAVFQEHWLDIINVLVMAIFMDTLKKTSYSQIRLFASFFAELFKKN